ncbi:MAG: SDR family NAD(P)-dependent oxidoreductase [Acidimicrobiia bacterium]|jgi:NAD(P)-dependent dehydrogenase (short-subunit alcohol dehydrogenase family)
METALVTGPSSGIGEAAAKELAALGFHVIAAGRSEQRTKRVIDEIETAGGSAEYLHLDLASLESVRQTARRVEEGGRALDILVNNAGVGVGRGVTRDGFEIQFGVNHLGHFALTHHLRRTFRPGTRIVQVTSSAHFNAGGIDFDRVRRRTQSLLGWREYCTSKLANVLFVRELARRQPDWSTYAVHPGMTDTGIVPAWIRPLVRHRLFTPEQGAETIVWCATSPEVGADSGRYYRNRESRPPSELAQDDGLAGELWRHSELWCGVAPQH